MEDYYHTSQSDQSELSNISTLCHKTEMEKILVRLKAFFSPTFLAGGKM